MELHSYAKRRTSKKWTIEQKRKLVEARISHDAWFVSKPSSVVPWKNILIAANLDDFNVFFVRKQWSNMLARYKQYKQSRLGNIASKAIDEELIKRINQEWEFFEPIHTFMTRKTTNLHSYALTRRTENSNGEQQELTGEELVTTSTITEEPLQTQQHQINSTPTRSHNETITINFQKDCVKENIPNNATIVMQANNISNDDGIHLFSSDTNEEFQGANETTRIINSGVRGEIDENMDCVRNTDHDFYSKRSYMTDIVGTKHQEDELQEQQSNYFADASEDSQGSMSMLVDSIHTNNETYADSSLTMATALEIKTENVTECECLALKEEIQDSEFLNDIPSTSAQDNQTHNITKHAKFAATPKPQLSERDKYYRHRRRFNRRLEKRFDAILQVMSQIVKAQYPTIDVAPLLVTINAATSTVNQMLSSASEDDSESDDSNLNIPTTTNKNE